MSSDLPGGCGAGPPRAPVMGSHPPHPPDQPPQVSMQRRNPSLRKLLFVSSVTETDIEFDCLSLIGSVLSVLAFICLLSILSYTHNYLLVCCLFAQVQDWLCCRN